MSDYFGSLIGKSFGQEAALKPRRAPMFAPSPYTAGVLAVGTAAPLVSDSSILPPGRGEPALAAEPFPAGNADREPPDRTSWRVPSADLDREVGRVDEIEVLQLSQPVAPAMSPPPGFSARGSAPFASDPSPLAPARAHRRSPARQREDQPGFRQAPASGHTVLPAQPSAASPRSDDGEPGLPETGNSLHPFPAQRDQSQRTLASESLPRDHTQHSASSAPAVALDQRPAAPDVVQPRPVIPALQPVALQSRATAQPPHVADHGQMHTRAGQKASAAGQAPSSGAIEPQPQQVDRRAPAAVEPPRQDTLADQRSQGPGWPTGASANQARLATIRSVGTTATAPADSSPAGSHPAPGPTRPTADQRATPENPPTDRDTLLIQPTLRPVQQETAALARAAVARPEPASASPAPPTIHVTIGRIEVRATAASAPLPRKPAPLPGMSLDEYLKMRNGGRR